jgi:hypothetical protein
MLGSNVQDFHDLYRGARLYVPGPDRWITGADLWPAVQRGARFIRWNLTSLGTSEPVDLVGYSRGGFGAIVLAQRLLELPTPVQVRFLGLFDAVDRTPTLTFGRVPGNVLTARHVRRDPRVHSRSYFGNTGLRHDALVDYKELLVWGTHSSLGGDPWEGDHPSALDPTVDWAASRIAMAWMTGEARSFGVPVA